MNIALSCITTSSDDIEEFMKRVDDEIDFMSKLNPPRNLSTLGQVLRLTKGIMDQFSKVLLLSSSNFIIVNWLIEVIRYTRYSMHRGPLLPGSTR